MIAPSTHRPRTGRRARERAQRCTEVLLAARRLLARKGYQRTTMVEIAAASEVALGTLYQLFPSKEAILCNLLEDYVDRLLTQARDAVTAISDARLQMTRIVRTQLEFSRANADVLRLYLSGWIGYDLTLRQRLGERIDAKYEQYLDLLAATLRRGIRDGFFAKRSPRRLAVALAGMVHALIRRWLLESHLDLLAEGDELLDLFFHGAAVAASTNSRRR